MTIVNKIGKGKFYHFRHDTLQTNYLIISSHGGAIAGQEAWRPNFETSFHFNQSYGAEAAGSPQHMMNRVIHGDKIEVIPGSGLVGDYVLSKFQDYHDSASSKKEWKKMKIADPGLEYEETYDKIITYVNQADPAFDMLTVRNRWFSKKSKLSTVCSTLIKKGLRYTNIICLFCRVKDNDYYHDVMPHLH
jgi:hypothetical protein